MGEMWLREIKYLAQSHIVVAHGEPGFEIHLAPFHFQILCTVLPLYVGFRCTTIWLESCVYASVGVRGEGDEMV